MIVALVVRVKDRDPESGERRIHTLSGVLDTTKLPDNDWRTRLLRGAIEKPGQLSIKIKAHPLEVEDWKTVGAVLVTCRVNFPATIEGMHLVNVSAIKIAPADLYPNQF